MKKDVDTLIKGALLSLCRERGISHISVSDLSIRAHINRCTFYQYYDGLDHLVREIENELIHNLTRIAADQKYYEGMDKYYWYCAALKSIVDKTQEYYPWLDVLLSAKGDPSFGSKMYRYIHTESHRMFNLLRLPKDSVFDDMCFGAATMFSHWIRTGARFDSGKLTVLMLLPVKEILSERPFRCYF
jgi:AcrR family transcriptional regulator